MTSTNAKTKYDRAETDSLVEITKNRRDRRDESGRVAIGDAQLVDRLGTQLEAARDYIVELERDPLREAFDKLRDVRRLRRAPRGNPVSELPIGTLRLHMFHDMLADRYDIPRWEDDGGAP